MFKLGKTVSSPTKIVQSASMQGIVPDHDDHSEAAPMRSTGRLVLFGTDDETDAHNWYVEFRCDICNALVRVGPADLLDDIRDALKGLGIIQN